MAVNVRHVVPKLESCVCKFCNSTVKVVSSTMYWVKPSDQFLDAHHETDTGWPCVMGSGLPVHENMNGYTGDPKYETVWQREKRLRQ